MTLLATLLVAALTRSEIIERMRQPPMLMTEGLVEVIADCPTDMRREYLRPIASFLDELCRKIAGGSKLTLSRRDEPGIIVFLGDVRTNLTDVIVRPEKRADNQYVTRIYLPAPGFADVERTRLETVKAFFRAVQGEVIDDETAKARLVASDPALRVDEEYASLAAWERGERMPQEDAYYLKLARRVLEPGVARVSDVLRFSSRLMLYPKVYALPFCNKYDACDFREAITLVMSDPRVRLAAMEKAPEIVMYGGGRSPELLAAANAYSEFLLDLARLKKKPEELISQLDAADRLLMEAMMAARLREEGNQE